jgi:hypothetical protein
LILSKSEIEHGIGILAQAVNDVVAGRVSDELVAPYAGW